MSTFGGPFEVFFNLQKLVILSESLEHRKRHDSTGVGDGVFGFYLLHHLKVMRVGFCLSLKNFIVELIGKFSLNDLGQNLSLGCEFLFDWNVCQDFFVKPMNLTDF